MSKVLFKLDDSTSGIAPYSDNIGVGGAARCGSCETCQSTSCEGMQCGCQRSECGACEINECSSWCEGHCQSCGENCECSSENDQCSSYCERHCQDCGQSCECSDENDQCTCSGERDQCYCSNQGGECIACQSGCQSMCEKGKQGVTQQVGHTLTSATAGPNKIIGDSTYNNISTYIKLALDKCYHKGLNPKYAYKNDLPAENVLQSQIITKNIYDKLKYYVDLLYMSSVMPSVTSSVTIIDYETHPKKMIDSINASKIPTNIPCCQDTNHESCLKRENN